VVNRNNAPSPPCGACRQVLAEFMDSDGLVSFPAGSDGTVITTTFSIAELLPFGTDLKLK
jgi:cytidine deaminase